MNKGRHVTTRSLPALLAGVLLGLGASACGGAQGDRGSAPRASSEPAAEGPQFTSTTTSAIPPGQSLRGDGDADNPSDIDGNGDSDGASVGGADNDSDNPTHESYDFPDKDDKATFAYGHRPSAAARRAIASVVKRYYVAASADDASTACAMLLPSLANSLAEDYGRAPGPSYLRGSTTCQAVMSKLFRHAGERLTEAITVVEVRVEGDHAQVVFSSRKMPASIILLMRQGSSWRVQETLGQSLP